MVDLPYSARIRILIEDDGFVGEVGTTTQAVDRVD